ncbi:MAG: hypothetical protein JWN78_495 [Bacteroidota bacterium]|nr:hypothetical protein [Bacteroidota bacterium]
MRNLILFTALTLTILSSCKKSDPNTNNLTATADQYVGNWRLYDSIESTNDVFQRDFYITKISDNKILIVNFPYPKDSIYMNTSPTTSVDTDNIRPPVTFVSFIHFTATEFTYIYEVNMISDIYDHTGYALKK